MADIVNLAGRLVNLDAVTTGHTMATGRLELDYVVGGEERPMILTQDEKVALLDLIEQREMARRQPPYIKSTY